MTDHSPVRCASAKLSTCLVPTLPGSLRAQPRLRTSASRILWPPRRGSASTTMGAHAGPARCSGISARDHTSALCRAKVPRADAGTGRHCAAVKAVRMRARCLRGVWPPDVCAAVRPPTRQAQWPRPARSRRCRAWPCGLHRPPKQSLRRSRPGATCPRRPDEIGDGRSSWFCSRRASPAASGPTKKWYARRQQFATSVGGCSARQVVIV